jgi:diadenosine tetraphosphate (Ap4A) HIT family hydrolase
MGYMMRVIRLPQNSLHCHVLPGQSGDEWALPTSYINPPEAQKVTSQVCEVRGKGQGAS